MGQRVILYKKLPSSDYLDDLVERGVLRAAMTFMPGGCYAGAGIFPETTMYATSGTLDGGSRTASACPYPEDPIACQLWEIEEIIHKYSFGLPQPFNAFVFVRLRAGFSDQWAAHVAHVHSSMRESLGTDAEPEFFAAGHLVGCGAYNAMFELLTSNHQHLQNSIRRLTDLDYVEDVMVGHLAAEDAKGFGDPGRGASLT